jgi:hypothetical protein
VRELLQLHFATGDDAADAELVAKIENGTYAWFCAKVTASRNDVELAVDYLGCCCYESYREFIEIGGYYQDMRATVVASAKAKILELTAGA